MTDLTPLRAALVVFVPLALVFFPGLAIIRLTNFRDILMNGSRVLLWSISISILGSFLIAALKLPIYVTAILAVGISVFFLFHHRKTIFSLSSGWAMMAVVLPIVLLYAVFSIPYLLKHNGLPTGDSQKAIFWAQDIITHNALPNYSISLEHLNRDAGDFFTPGLHTVTAMAMSLSPQPLMTVGFLAIVAAAALAWIVASISKEVFNDKQHIIPPLLAAVFMLTNFRFLRYLREPGYHFQNLIGELLLFGLLLVGIRLLRTFNRQDFALATLLGLSLVLSHQFSVFVGFFALLPIGILLFVTKASTGLRSTIMLGLGALAIAAIPFGFYEKLPHLFTTDAHLGGLIPTLIGYPLTMGSIWFLFGIAGLILLAKYAYTSKNTQARGFAMATFLVLALSQGPRLFIDIPPVRALFYSIVPLSICAAYFVMTMRHFIEKQYTGWMKSTLLAALAIAIIIPMSVGTTRAYQTSTHASAPNSTATPDLLFAAERLSVMQGGAVLIDDYNRRAASWLILSGKPMFTRIAADIERQMNESTQSQARMDLYIRQLQYEKIFALASNPLIANIMDSNGITFLSAVEKRTTSGLMHNPALTEVLRAKNTTIFMSAQPPLKELSSLDEWLLHTNTLANDIGDDEDTFQHLQASIRTARLSPPQYDGVSTFRVTSSPYIVLEFNVTDYVARLWDQDENNQFDAHLELLLQTTFGPDTLSFLSGSGAEHPITPGETIKISPKDITLTDKGNVQIILLNPTESLVGIDLIALGLGRIP